MEFNSMNEITGSGTRLFSGRRGPGTNSTESAARSLHQVLRLNKLAFIVIIKKYGSLLAAACLALPFGTAGAQPFTLAVVGDTQFKWSCQSENTRNSTYCAVDDNWNKPANVQALETNQLVINRVDEIRNASGMHFKGLVINGDLTSSGDRDGDLSSFINTYTNQTRFTVWPGLGNHDYQNNIDDCGTRGWSNWNYCGAEMMQFIARWLVESPDNAKLVSYDVTRYSKNTAQAQEQRNISGSLAYSWEIGDFHFVQLNNYPTYQKSFTRGYSSGISSWDLNATSPADWIAQDFAKAVINKKVIVLNWHKFGDIYGDQNMETNPDYAALVRMMDKYAVNIKAIFVAHFHADIGQITSLTFPPSSNHAAAISVPVIYSGSPIYGRFIKADFDSNETDCTIRISNVDANIPYAGTTTDPRTIPCTGLNDVSAYELDFGGAYGYVQGGQAVNNPATGDQSCPASYTNQEVYGAVNKDYAINMCFRRTSRRDPGDQSVFDFGGMWGHVGGTATKNPLTGASSCPSGFSDVQVLGTYNLDWDLHMCYRAAGNNPPMKFGGVLTYKDGMAVPNQVTGETNCPPGYAQQDVLGQYNVDWPFAYCYSAQPKRLDFGGAYGYINGGSPVVNPITNAQSCPAGYSNFKAFGAYGTDWPVHVCFRPHVKDVAADYDFGGMWGYINGGQLVTNPATGQGSCGADFTDVKVLDTHNQDWSLHVCYRPHKADSNQVLWFGGVLGTVEGQAVNNPATGTSSCPAGYLPSKVLGTHNTDWNFSFCYSVPDM